jgi:prepilin-type N-terminal cleavage/methylation domain-containing protein
MNQNHEDPRDGDRAAVHGPTATRFDRGYTLIELLFVIVIVGLIASIAVFAVTGMTTEAASSSCQADRRQLGVSVESYFAQVGTDVVAATGDDHDRFERTLVDGGFLRAVSTYHDLDAAGAVISEGNPPC